MKARPRPSHSGFMTQAKLKADKTCTKLEAMQLAVRNCERKQMVEAYARDYLVHRRAPRPSRISKAYNSLQEIKTQNAENRSMISLFPIPSFLRK